VESSPPEEICFLSNAIEAAGYFQASERRAHLRHDVLLSCIQLADDNGGIILDICEDGLSMQVVRGLADDPFPQLRFQLSQSNVWIETRGRIAWVSASKRTAGVKFVDLSFEALTLLKEWISSNVYPTATSQENALGENIGLVSAVLASYEETRTVSVSQADNARLVDEMPSQDLMAQGLTGVLHSTKAQDAGAVLPETGKNTQRLATENVSHAAGLRLSLFSQQIGSESGKHERTSDSSRTRQPIILYVSVVLFLSTFGFLGYHLRTGTNGWQSRQIIAPTSVPGASSNNSLRPVTLSPTLSPNAQLSLDTPGFILQAGAMRHEENAEALAELLRQNDFPAFVIEPGANPLYRVAVGPYSDVDSALKVKEALKRHGFDTIRTKWNPAPQ
jgi:hypothetical protein